MYPITCAGGFPVPLKAGKFEIVGYSCAPSAVGTAMEVMLVDDITIKQGDLYGKLIGNVSDNPKNIIAQEKVGAGFNAIQVFGESIKTRYGLSVYVENCQPGSFCVYIK